MCQPVLLADRPPRRVHIRRLQPRAIIELRREVRLGAGCVRDMHPRRGPRHLTLGADELALRTTAKPARAGPTMLVDRTPKRHHRQPTPRVGNLLTRGDRGVETLPRLGVTRFQITAIEAHPSGAQTSAYAAQHLLTQPPELLAQQALGSVATQGRRAHGPGRLRPV